MTAFYCNHKLINDYKVQQHLINQRISFLLNSLKLSARAFSEAIGEKPTITQNYVGTRNSMPGADYLEKILKHFDSINPSWLIKGEGEPFLNTSHATNSTNIKNNSGVGVSHGGTNNFTNNLNIDDCRRELENVRRELASLRREVELQNALLASKEEMLTLLRASHNRPN